MKKILPLLIVLIVLFLIIQGFLAFYALAYIRFNEWNSMVNRNNIEENIPDMDWISGENYKKLRVVDDFADNEFAQLKTKKKFKFSSLTEMTITCNIHVTVTNTDTHIKVREFDGKRTVKFKFEEFKWKVIEVKTE